MLQIQITRRYHMKEKEWGSVIKGRWLWHKIWKHPKSRNLETQEVNSSLERSYTFHRRVKSLFKNTFSSISVCKIWNKNYDIGGMTRKVQAWNYTWLYLQHFYCYSWALIPTICTANAGFEITKNNHCSEEIFEHNFSHWSLKLCSDISPSQ